MAGIIRYMSRSQVYNLRCIDYKWSLCNNSSSLYYLWVYTYNTLLFLMK